MRLTHRLAWMSGVLISVALAVLLALTVPAAMDRDARAAEVAGHEAQLNELSAGRNSIRPQIEEVRADLEAQREANDAAAQRIKKQKQQIRDLQARIAELEA